MPEVIEEVLKDIKVQLARELLPASQERLFAVSALMKRIKNRQTGHAEKTIDHRYLYDFPRFQETFICSMKESKKYALLMTLKPLHVDGIRLKCSALRERIWSAATLSGVAGLSPIPGTSLAVDTGILVEEVYHYIKCLKLTEDEIRKYASCFGVDYADLKRDVIDTNPFFSSIVTLGAQLSLNLLKVGAEAIAKALIPILFEYLKKYAAVNAAEEALKAFGLSIPIVGSVVASLLGAGISFTSTLLSLRSILDNFEQSSIKIVEYCNENRYKRTQ